MSKKIGNYVLQSQLGVGNYSKVYKAVDVITQKDVAIKMISSKKIQQIPQLQTGIRNQVNTLLKIDSCQHIVRYFDMLKTTNNFYFVYQYCNGGTLEAYLKKYGPLPQSKAIPFLKQLLDGFKVLYQQNIMHRDIKTQNILIHDGVLKIADFGFCKPLESQDQISHTMLGSPIYMAPQILRDQPYTNKADIWSIGVVFYRLLFGVCPYQSQNIAQLIDSHSKKDLFIPSQPPIAPATEQLLRKMLTRQPKDRIQWSQIFKYKVLEKGIIVPPQTKSLGLNLAIDNFPNMSKNKNERLKSSEIRLSVGTTSPKNNMRDSTSYSQSAYNKLNNGKINTIIKNHGKTTEIFNIVVQIANYSNLPSLNLSFQLTFMVQKEIKSFLESIQRQIKIHTFGVNPQQDDILNEFYNILQSQMNSVQDVLAFLSEQTGKRQIQTPIKETLKQFLNSLRLLNEDQLMLVLQLIDYIEDGIVIKKITYPRRSYEQLKRHVEQKKTKLLKG